MTVETFKLYTQTGRYIRKSTKVTFPDGYVVRFLDPHTSKKAAIAQAIVVRQRQEA